MSGLDGYSPITGPDQLISESNQPYEAPLLPTPPLYFEPSPPSPVNIEMNPAPTLAMETNVVLTLLHIPASPTPNAGTGAGAAIHLVSLPPSFIGTANAGVVAPQAALSDNAARAQIEAYIRTSLWFQLHALESHVGELGVPVSALRLARRGHSIWACFFKRVRRKGTLFFKCTTCGHESNRLHRAVSHQRTKWGHKPFACTDPGW
jgi:hypothetical protein